MYLVSLVYASTRYDDWSDNDIYQILAHSKQNNKEADITGTLCFNGEFFLQCLEGSRTAVNKLYRKIHSDQRHQDIILLHYDEISSRSFDSWSMLYVPVSAINQSLVMRYSGTKFFNPYQMNGESALRLCRELALNSPESPSDRQISDITDHGSI